MIDNFSVKKALVELANKALESDASGAARLRLLSDAVVAGPGADADAWAAIDIYQFVNPDSIVEHVISQRAREKYIDYLELARNTLVLGPIIVTWFGISQATQAYNTLLTSHPEQATEPFLYLWQQGFGGHLQPSILTLSTVALIDAAILVGIFILTFITYYLSRVSANRSEQEAMNLRAELVHALAGASLCLYSNRLQSMTAGNNLEGVARQIDTMTRQTTSQFQKMVDQVLNQFTAMTKQTTTRFSEMADQVYAQFNGVARQMGVQLLEGDKYLMKLSAFVSGLDQLSKNMQEGARILEATNGQLSTNLNDLVGPAKELSIQQKSLAEAAKESVTLLQGASTTLADLGRKQDRWGAELSDILDTVNVAVEKAVQLATTVGNFTTQQGSFLQYLEKERNAQSHLATLMSNATVSVREALADMGAGGKSLRSMAHDMKDMLDLQRTTNTTHILQDYALAAQTIEKGAASLNASAIALYNASQRLTNVIDNLEDRLTTIKR